MINPDLYGVDIAKEAVEAAANVAGKGTYSHTVFCTTEKVLKGGGII